MKSQWIDELFNRYHLMLRALQPLQFHKSHLIGTNKKFGSKSEMV